jgi:hypothetical protein
LCVLHKVEVGIENFVGFAQVIACEPTPQLGALNGLWSYTVNPL